MEKRFRLREKDLVLEITRVYSEQKSEIASRLEEFKRIWESGDDTVLFTELVFCILTPQSKARTCWAVVESLLSKNLILDGGEKEIVRELNRTRFKNKKTAYILHARRLFSANGKVSIVSKLQQFRDAREARDWLAGNVRGIGLKEASHFLRNIGFGEDLAILDRHVLRSLSQLRVIEKVPTHLTEKMYLKIENQMSRFAQAIKVPLHHLDLVLWFKETGKIFK
jgi:N-glycosylase/DNA lyase